MHEDHCHIESAWARGQALKVAVVDVSHLEKFATEPSIQVATKSAFVVEY